MSRFPQDTNQQPSRSRSPTPSPYGTQYAYPAAPSTNAAFFPTSNPGHSYQSGVGMNTPSQYQNQYTMGPAQPLPSSGSTERQAYSFPEPTFAPATYMQGLNDTAFNVPLQGSSMAGYNPSQDYSHYTNPSMNAFGAAASMQPASTGPNSFNMQEFSDVNSGLSGPTLYGNYFYNTLPANQNNMMPYYGTHPQTTYYGTPQQFAGALPQFPATPTLQTGDQNPDSFDDDDDDDDDEGETNTAAALGSELDSGSSQSTKSKTRQCDRCHKYRVRCTSTKMPCARCKRNGADCTDDRPFRAVVPTERPTHWSGVVMSPPASDTPSSAAVMSQSPYSDTSFAERFDMTMVQSLRYLNPPCDRCYLKGFFCQSNRMPCLRCKDDQVICTSNRSRSKGS